MFSCRNNADSLYAPPQTTLTGKMKHQVSRWAQLTTFDGKPQPDNSRERTKGAMKSLRNGEFTLPFNQADNAQCLVAAFFFFFNSVQMILFLDVNKPLSCARLYDCY